MKNGYVGISLILIFLAIATNCQDEDPLEPLNPSHGAVPVVPNTHDLTPGAIAGIAISSVLGAFVIGLIIYFFVGYMKKREGENGVGKRSVELDVTHKKDMDIDFSESDQEDDESVDSDDMVMIPTFDDEPAKRKEILASEISETLDSIKDESQNVDTSRSYEESEDIISSEA